MNDGEQKGNVLENSKDEPCRHPKLEAGKNEGEIACVICGRVLYAGQEPKPEAPRNKEIT